MCLNLGNNDNGKIFNLKIWFYRRRMKKGRIKKSITVIVNGLGFLTFSKDKLQIEQTFVLNKHGKEIDNSYY